MTKPSLENDREVLYVRISLKNMLHIEKRSLQLNRGKGEFVEALIEADRLKKKLKLDKRMSKTTPLQLKQEAQKARIKDLEERAKRGNKNIL